MLIFSIYRINASFFIILDWKDQAQQGKTLSALRCLTTEFTEDTGIHGLSQTINSVIFFVKSVESVVNQLVQIKLSK